MPSYLQNNGKFLIPQPRYQLLRFYEIYIFDKYMVRSNINQIQLIIKKSVFAVAATIALE
jgi:hypothetical protein